MEVGRCAYSRTRTGRSIIDTHLRTIINENPPNAALYTSQIHEWRACSDDKRVDGAVEPAKVGPGPTTLYILVEQGTTIAKI